MSPIRTRFAPSPTGYLHLGSARTALFNWAYAQHHGGQFVLRIEDTDRQRSTLESERAVLEGLEWLGLGWDEGPLRQSERHERHGEVIEQLLAEGRAYRCLCTPDDIEQRRNRTLQAGGSWVYDGRCRERALGSDCGPHAVRLRVAQDDELRWDDLVFGPSGQSGREIGDMIIRRSDGGPLFHLAVVVDDIDMQISHVIRGADLLNSTSFQIAIYRALGASVPAFAHVPLIVSASGKKLSKRRDPVSIQDFRDQGFLPEAMRNWLVRLGWSHGDDEIFSLDEIARLFDLDAVGRTSAQTDPDKLAWLNQHYIKELPMGELLRAALPHLEREAGGTVEPSPALTQLLDLQRERSKTLVQMAELSRWWLRDEIEIDAKAAKKHLRPVALPIVEALRARFDAIDDWTGSRIQSVFEDVATELGDLSMGKLAQPVRVAVTGGTVSPGIYETLVALGRERSLQRLDRALESLRERSNS